MKPSFVIIKGQARGLQIDNMKQEAGGVWAVKFARKDTVYHYARRDVVVLTETRYFNPNDCQVYVGSQLQRAVTGITAFPQGERTHWRLTYGNGSVRDFVGGNGIEVRQNCLADENARNVFEYLKAIAGVNQLGKDQYSQ